MTNMSLIVDKTIKVPKDFDGDTLCLDDGGMCKIIEFDCDNNIIIQIRSYSEDFDHSSFNTMLGKTIKVTVEILSDYEED